MRYEFIVESYHPEEGAEVRESSRWWQVSDTLDLVFCHANPFSTDDIEAKKVAFLREPFALMGLEAETVIPKGLQDEADVFFVFIK